MSLYLSSFFEEIGCYKFGCQDIAVCGNLILRADF